MILKCEKYDKNGDTFLFEIDGINKVIKPVNLNTLLRNIKYQI